MASTFAERPAPDPEAAADAAQADATTALAQIAALPASPVNPILDADFSAAQGVMVKDSAGTYRVIKCNFAGAVAPAVTDDAAAGYAVGSLWINTALGLIYMCADSTNGAAVWKALG